jgi:hypothetical protein
MTPALHEKTGFKLAKPHNLVACKKCHETRGEYSIRYPNPKETNYNRGQKNCEGCHSDFHEGQFIKKYPHCYTCHVSGGFLPAKFTSKNHGVFPLEGGHLSTACAFCHKPKSLRGGGRRYTGTPRECAVCHEDVHRGQFKENGVTRCDKCHNSTFRWNRVSFNHNAQSRFKLDKAHINVQCYKCHPTVTVKGGEKMMVFKPLKMQCKDCHSFE